VIRSTLFQLLLRLCFVALLLYCWSWHESRLLKGLLMLFIIGNLVTIVFTFAVLWQRVREIEKGELEEAKKY